MARIRGIHVGSAILLSLGGSGLGACSLVPTVDTTGSVSPNAKVVQAPTRADRECLARAMYFESNRTDEDGMLAVGTVVMNRLDSPKYPGSICEVVGQKRQFAPGALTKPVREADLARVERVADAVLSGQRHEKVGPAMHFHTAGLTFKYTNMHYVALAGGNTFYEKTDRDGYLPAVNPQAVVRTAGGALAPIQAVAVLDAGPIRSTDPSPRIPTIAATQVAYGPILPAGVPTRYTSAFAAAQ